jgi:hypothetical protein
MSRSALEVADIFRDLGAAWRRANAGHVSLEQMKVMSAIERCRIAALGGHVARCEDCAHRECQKFCVRDFCEGGFVFWYMENATSSAWSSSLLGRTERSSPEAAERRAEGAGLDGESADRAIIGVAVMSVVVVIALFLENARRIGWQTGPWRRSIRSLAATAGRHF